MNLAIIQARLGSTRLPGKVLKEISGKSILEHIVYRISKSKLIDKIVVATTNNSEDDRIEDMCKKIGVDCFRGSQENVLERFFICAQRYEPSNIIRVTADDPLKDPEVIDKALGLIVNTGYDYVSNTIIPTYPEGLDIEVFKYSTLERAYKEAKLLSEKEHVTPYIWKNPSLFKTFNFFNEIDLSKMRWTLDTEDDYIFIEEIYKRLYVKDKVFLMKDILEILFKNPELSQINNKTIRNEGYLKSIINDEEKK